MILNISTIKSWDTCERAAFYTHHAQLGSGRSTALAIGTAFHNSIAIGLARGWHTAIEYVATASAAEIAPTLDECEQFKLQEYVDTTVAMVKAYQQAYQPVAELWQVLHPEVEFLTSVPRSEHNCIMHHWVNCADGTEHWDVPPHTAIMRGLVQSPHEYPDPQCHCWQPHRLAGKTDAIVVNNNNIWLFEHKTTSFLSHVWWKQWELDKQPTAYIWGVWRSLGLRPSGIMLNAVRKPTADQLASWNRNRTSTTARPATDYIQFERRPFLRSLDDLQRFERQLRRTMDTWEAAICDADGLNAFPMRNIGGNCTSYNRVCSYHELCVNHGDAHDNTLVAFPRREPSYVHDHEQKLGAAITASRVATEGVL